MKLTIAMLMLLCLSLAWAEPMSKEIMEAAQQGLPQFLAQTPDDMLPLFGITSREELQTAQLSDPFQVHIITPDKLKASRGDSSVKQLMEPTNLWYFPIMVGEQTKLVLVVDHTDGKWQAVSLGYAPLARELHQVRQQWNRRDGYHPVLAMMPQVRAFVFSVPEVSDTNLTILRCRPVTGERTEVQNYENIKNAKDTIEALQQQFEQQ